MYTHYFSMEAPVTKTQKQEIQLKKSEKTKQKPKHSKYYVIILYYIMFVKQLSSDWSVSLICVWAK